MSNVKTDKPYSLYMLLESSQQDDNLVGVFHTTAYILQITGKYLVIKIEDTMDPHDILSKDIKHNTLQAEYWRPYWEEGSHSEISLSEKKTLLIPVTHEFLKANAPIHVVNMICCAMHDTGKNK